MNTPSKKMKIGSYAAGTTNQLQGASSNKSQQDLDAMNASSADSGAALRAAAPVGNQSYAEFQRTRNTPQGQADKASYEASNKLPRLTDADYQQRRFDEGTSTLKQRAQSNPDQSVFSGAPTNAAYASQRDQAMRLGNYQDTGTAAVTSQSLADRSSKMQAQGAYSAPGMAMAPVQKDMGSSAPIKKDPMSVAGYKMGAKKMMVGKYAAGTKSITGKPSPTGPFSDDEDQEDNAGTQESAAAEQRETAGLDAAAAEEKAQNPGPVMPKMRLSAAPAPSASAKPADYQDAAKAIRADKDLLAQYHKGVASGKAFSVNIGGKNFKYAATPVAGSDKPAAASPKPAADPAAKVSPAAEPVATTPGADSTSDLQRMGFPGLGPYNSDPVTKEVTPKAKAKAAPVASPGTATNTATSKQSLQEDAEKADLRNQVKKMALAKKG